MRLTGPLIVVEDMERSIKFYEQVIGAQVEMDLGGNVTMTTGHILQESSYWYKFLAIGKEEVVYKNNAFELYFEEDHFDEFIKRLKKFPDIEYANEVTEFPWGQKTVRIYDPDMHLVEIGQSMKSVIRQCVKNGMTPEQAAERTQHPIAYVLKCLKEE